MVGEMVGSRKVPTHLAINTAHVKKWAQEQKKDLSEVLKRHFEILHEIIDYQLKNSIRVVTVGLTDDDPDVLKSLKDFFYSLSDDERIHKNQVRVFVIGQWYQVESELADSFKQAMEKTKMYDNFFLNFAVNYDGREEVLSAIKLMVRKINAKKLSEDDLNADAIKENLSSSYFPPPELIIETRRSYSGLLLWDAKGAVIHFSSRRWPTFERKDLDEAINFYNSVIAKDKER
ncbi:undecaprenyl diphosphate synthase family protein [Candidatus Woesearchaeota archaeon]|nr:undecaprenyl diphosphate synthase family protein [Candidatus Woesearchaeota archaeon]